jgi:hypothetical protein
VDIFSTVMQAARKEGGRKEGYFFQGLSIEILSLSGFQRL